jgi:hypothetical protein
MSRQVAAALCSAVLGLIALSSLGIAEQKTAKACLGEWRANKAANEANGVTLKAYLAQCRAGGALAQAGAASATAGTVGAGASNASRDPPIDTTIQDLMQSIIDPSADGLWNAVGTVVDKEGIHELLPKTPDDWRDVRHAAVRIVEGSNLLMVPGREAAPAGTKSEAEGVELEPAQITALVKKNRQTFDSFAKALQAVGVEAMRASDAKDVMLLMDIGARMEGICEGCHQTFWYPPEKPAARN